MAKERLKCPVCGVEMNNHAEKISYETSPEGGHETDPDFGGILQEVHTCPKCGGVEVTQGS